MNLNRLKLFGLLFMFLSSGSADAQTFEEQYEAFKQQTKQEYQNFRDKVNQEYADFIRSSWAQFKGEEPTPEPDLNPIPPLPYEKEKEKPPVVVVNPKPIPEPEPEPQPKPFEPIYENPNVDENILAFDFYGVPAKIRFPKNVNIKLNDLKPRSLAKAWENLSSNDINNTIRDCLEARIRYNLSDWAYLLFLQEVGRSFSSDPNVATFITAFLFCQSGYQMRLAVDLNKLMMLYGSRHHIYNTPYYNIDGTMFYPFGNTSRSLNICNARFEGETPLSLIIEKEQTVGPGLSNPRQIVSERYKDMKIETKVPVKLISFFDTYPSSQLGTNPLTRWAMYANVPLAKDTKEIIYPELKKAIDGISELDAANKLLNWVQTGLVYEYDDKVWGHDRAFFAEETLFYPYADCEDRAILFSRLVRDLLGLDVALVYYPGHLATAVAFKDNVAGDAMMIDGKKFIVCDPTYIGAPVGAQMPGLNYSQTQAIRLQR